MKTIKIYAVGSHQTKERTSGVDYARVLLPMKHLNGYQDSDVSFQVDFYDINKEKGDNWPSIAKNYDIIFLNYTVLDWQYASMGAFVHGEGKKIIMDLDDAIWFVQEDNIVHKQLKEMNAEYILSCILDDVDGITTTNSYLKNVIVDKTYRRHEHIKVMENQIDLDLYNKTFPSKENDTITLMHFGSTSHFDDLLDKDFVNAMDRIFREYPNVVFKSVGAFISELRYKWGVRYINAFGDVDIYKWAIEKFPQYMEEADIIVVPLRDTLYNRCKSDIKFIESSSAMKPCIFSSVRQYKDSVIDGKTGMIASNEEEWYTKLKKLIDSVKLRNTIGKNAYNYVKKNRQMKDHVKEYADYFKQILDK